MGFLAPLMLLGGLAAGIPVAIHFFFRSRYRTVPWAAMKFLLTSVEQTSRRLKFQEYLLLQTRIAVLVFLALALARPVNLSLLGCIYAAGATLITIVTATWVLAPWWKISSSKGANYATYAASQLALASVCGALWWLFPFIGSAATSARARGTGDAVDAVFVFDVSFSMAANDSAKTRLTRGTEEAINIIDELPPHSTVQIITCAGGNKTLLGPRSPANLDQARTLLQELEVTHLATNLYPGVAEAENVLQRGLASNKELYIFSDMQKLGWEQQASELKQSLVDVNEKAIVHLVRCGTRPLKNVAIVDITPQSSIPRPGERVAFAILIRNTGKDAVKNLTVSLAVDGDEKNVETTAIADLPGRTTQAVTLSGKLGKPGLRVLTAKVKSDDLEADNRFDQVIYVRDQINILVVDGNYHEREPKESSSFHLMHALLPVRETEAATYKFRPRVVPARLAAPGLLGNQDLCILVNVSLRGKFGDRPEKLPMPQDFAAALDSFVRKGHGLIILSGDNTRPETYNQVFGKELGLLPMPLKAVVKATGKEPFLINRNSFGAGPVAFQIFKDYTLFDFVDVWQHVEMDERPRVDIESLRYRLYQQAWTALPDFSKLTADEEGELSRGLFDLSPRKVNKDFGFVFEGNLLVPENGNYTFYLDSADGARLSVSGTEIIAYDGLHEMGQERKETVKLAKGLQPIKLEYFQHSSTPGLTVAWSGPGLARRPLSALKDENPLSVVVRLNNNSPLIVTKKVDRGEVMFIGTAVHPEGTDAKTQKPLWNNFNINPVIVPFVDIAVNHLLSVQMQTYNLVAGQTLTWHPTDKHNFLYNLEHPDGKTVDRLKPPEKVGQRLVVTATDLPRAGIYRLKAVPREDDAHAPKLTDEEKAGIPIAVIPDLRESEDLTSLAEAEIDASLGFTPIHIVAGDANAVSTESDRLNREWTVWGLLAVLTLVLGEAALAWWSGRAW